MGCLRQHTNGFRTSLGKKSQLGPFGEKAGETRFIRDRRKSVGLQSACMELQEWNKMGVGSIVELKFECLTGVTGYGAGLEHSLEITGVISGESGQEKGEKGYGGVEKKQITLESETFIGRQQKIQALGVIKRGETGGDGSRLLHRKVA